MFAPAFESYFHWIRGESRLVTREALTNVGPHGDELWVTLVGREGGLTPAPTGILGLRRRD